MRIVLYIEKLNESIRSGLANQIEIYDSICETVCIDNTDNQIETELLLNVLSEIELPNTVYRINNRKLHFSDSVNEWINDDYVILTNESVSVCEADIREMKRIADLGEHHVFVVPRSNVEGLQQYPGPEEIIDSEEIRRWQKEYLKEYTMLPFCYGNCVLLKGKKVAKHLYPSQNGEYVSGFSGVGYTQCASVYEYSLLLADYGMSSVCANYAYSSEDNRLSIDDKTELAKVNNEFSTAINNGLLKYRDYYCHPYEKYGWVLGKKADKTKIMYFMGGLPAYVNGSSVHMIGVLEGIVNAIKDINDYDITIVAPRESAEFHGLYTMIGEKYKIIEMNDISDIYDICFIPMHLIDRHAQKICADHALRLIFWPLDLISLRSNYLCEPQYIGGYEFMARYSDGLMFFSESVCDDFNAYFSYVKELESKPQKVSYLPDAGKTNKSESVCEELPFDDYYLIMGNPFLHKMIYPALVSVARTGKNFIIVGTDENKMIGNHLALYKSGTISDSYINKLYEKCKGLIYPSIYEGFGLPPVQALNLGKEVFAMDMPVNHELENLAQGFRGHIHYFDSLGELPQILDEFESRQNVFETNGLYRRKWIDVGKDCLMMIKDLMKNEPNEERLYLRRMAVR